MFCYQCEQTAKGVGCTVSGVCGKNPEVAGLQDLLIHACKGLSMYAARARKLGVQDHAADVFTVEAIFATLTNVNFDPAALRGMIAKAAQVRARVKAEYENACKAAGKTPEALSGPAAWQPAADPQSLSRQAEEVAVLRRKQSLGDDVTGLQELIVYGLKGVAAYADHAQILGRKATRSTRSSTRRSPG